MRSEETWAAELTPPRDPANISARISDGKVGRRAGDAVSPQRVAELVERARQGDRDAFGELYRAYQGTIHRMARFHLVGDGAEDAVAETFLRAWAGLPRYRNTGAPFVAWLYGIARHVVVDEMARRRRVEPREILPEVALMPAEEERIALREAVERLPYEQRQVIELKYLVGLTNTEVATAFKTTPGAVNAKQWRALRSLLDMLGER